MDFDYRECLNQCIKVRIEPCCCDNSSEHHDECCETEQSCCCRTCSSCGCGDLMTLSGCGCR